MPTPECLSLILPEPPSANRYWRHGKGRTYIAKTALAYRESVRWAYLTVRKNTQIAYPTGLLRVELHWYRGRKSGDLDNRIKQVLDAMRGLAYTDDKQIVQLTAERHEDQHNPRMEVTLSRPVS